MYIILSLFILLCMLFVLLNHHRKKCIIRKVCEMPCEEKCCLINELAEPFGFCYQNDQDIFTTRTDAWQREFGYSEFYNTAALSMNMVFDHEPVYFNYQGKTWLMEFWKGQYGINTGAEAGIYHADSIIPPALRRQTIFQAAGPEEMLPLTLHLGDREGALFCISQTHWWLAGFITGLCTPPEQLHLDVSITFPDSEMCDSFLRSLYDRGYKSCDICVCHNTVQFCLFIPRHLSILSGSFYKKYVLWKTRIFCRLYLWVTRPLCSTLDRLLYLYYFLPFIFRRTLCMRTFKKHRKRRR